jgi:ferredoxin
LRPPGAIEEERFLDACQRCGACVEICPAHAIFPLTDSQGAAAGTPAVDADRAACVVCEGLRCTTVCPSGALLELTNPADIRMGIAEVYAPVCVRTHGDACDLCVERCPLGDVAIAFVDKGPPEIREAGCVGCGVCQYYCPSIPKAIIVRPLGEK